MNGASGQLGSLSRRGARRRALARRALPLIGFEPESLKRFNAGMLEGPPAALQRRTGWLTCFISCAPLENFRTLPLG